MDKQLAVVPREESRAVVLSGLSALVHLLQIQIERRAVPSQICLESPLAWWVASRFYPSGLVGWSGSRKERLHDLLSFFFQQILCGITYSSDQVVLKICYWLVLGLNLAKTTFQFSKWVPVKIESCKGGQLKVVGQQKWPNDHPDRTGSCRATNLGQKIF